MEIKVLDAQLVLAGNTFEHRTILKSLMGAGWSKHLKAWTYPLNPDVFFALRAYFPDLIVDESCSEIDRVIAKNNFGIMVKEADTQSTIELTKTQPWAHQIVAFNFAMARFRGSGGVMLALDMGTGKTKVAIDVINGMHALRVLIICPKSVVHVWPEEFVKHSYAPYRVSPLGAGLSVKQKAFLVHGPGVYVINKDAVWRNPLREKLIGIDWDIVIHDECHQGKTPGSKISRFMHLIGKRVKHRMGLTGTPAPHSPLDIYAQFRFLEPSIFGTSFGKFKNQYAVMGGFEGKQVIGYKNEMDMRDKFETVAYQVRSDDVLDLPEIQEIERTCDLSPAERRAYKLMKDELIFSVEDGTVTAANAMVKVLRLAQIANGVTRDEEGRNVKLGDSKETLLGEVLDGLSIDEPVVVFCRFRSDLDSVQARSVDQGRTYHELSGRVNQLSEWKESGQVLGVQIQAGGVGVDLTRAHYCIYFSPTFSLGDHEQSRKRVHRPGQRKDVVYIHLIARGTVDRHIYRALREKKNIVEEILGQIGRD